MIEGTQTVGSIAAGIPGAMAYFEKNGIDYCCGGNRSLTDAVKEKGVDERAVFAQLGALEKQARRQSEPDFREMDAPQLSGYIVNVHHTYLRRVLPEISELFSVVMRAHGLNHPELFEGARRFGALRGDLEQHLIKEELLLFPALQREEGTREAAALTPGIISEHEEAGTALEHLSEITGCFSAPEDACASYRKLYRLLDEMTEDLHRHIHLENNILLKK